MDIKRRLFAKVDRPVETRHLTLAPNGYDGTRHLRKAATDASQFLDLTLDAINRRGRGIQVRVRCTPDDVDAARYRARGHPVMEELDGRP